MEHVWRAGPLGAGAAGPACGPRSLAGAAAVILPLDAGTTASLERLGGKGAGLARLLQHGFRVPELWCLPADAELEGASLERELRALAARLEARFPDSAWAVRSSATAEDLEDASFAGVYRTVLGVRGAEALVAAVEECRASVRQRTGPGVPRGARHGGGRAHGGADPAPARPRRGRGPPHRESPAPVCARVRDRCRLRPGRGRRLRARRPGPPGAGPRDRGAARGAHRGEGDGAALRRRRRR